MKRSPPNDTIGSDPSLNQWSRFAKAKHILGQIQTIAAKHGGGLLIVRRDAGFTGVGYISLPKQKEISFDFSFTNSGYVIKIEGEDEIFSRLRTNLEYDDHDELEATLERIEALITSQGN